MIAARPGVVHFVVPASIDDPEQTSGGNVFDRRIADELAARGWAVHLWKSDAATPVGAVLAALPAGSVVLVDGMLAGDAPASIEAQAERLRIVVLAHMVRAAFDGASPGAVEGERRAVSSASAVIATSEWTRGELIRRAGVDPRRVFVALPGATPAGAVDGRPDGRALLCVGVVAPHKGQDVLVEALASLGATARWTCTIAGSLAAFPAFAGRVSALAADGVGDERVRLAGVLSEDELEQEYRRADLVVAPSRVESYGMGIADALGRGIPVLASAVGGIPQTVAASGGAVLIPPGQPQALGAALGRWMADPDLRRRLKSEALRGRSAMPSWDDTADRVGAALAGVR